MTLLQGARRRSNPRSLDRKLPLPRPSCLFRSATSWFPQRAASIMLFVVLLRADSVCCLGLEPLSYSIGLRARCEGPNISMSDPPVLIIVGTCCMI